MVPDDWDFGDANWQLDATHFVSAPTAINGKVPYCRRVLCRLAESLVLPQGRVVTQLYLTGTVISQVVFRHQSALGDASFKDCYAVHFQNDEWIYFKNRLGFVETKIDEWPIKPTLDQWQRWRVTWWNGVDLMNNPAIAVELHQHIAGDWLSYGVLYDPLNRWENSDKNRVGLGFLYSGAWADDTEIWIPL